MSAEKMVRVSRRNPCPVCGKPDWCLVAPDRSAAICPRIEFGSAKKCGEAGWLHILKDSGNRRASSRPRRVRWHIPITSAGERDFGALAEHYRVALPAQKLAELARELTVSAQSLRRMGVGWNGVGFTFPMRNTEGKVIGIRVRYPNGSKAAVDGTRNALFVPADLGDSSLLLITEGPTDCAAMLDLGFDVVGRPSCNTGAAILRKLARGRKVVIAGDNNAPGRRGAEALAAEMVLCCRSVRVIYPPEGLKDLRQWKVPGLGSATLKRMIATTRPVRLSITSHVREEAL